MKHNRCETCLYFKINLASVGQQSGQAGAGECRRYPPTPYPSQDQQGRIGIMNLRPPVNKADQCGEWAPATNAQGLAN